MTQDDKEIILSLLRRNNLESILLELSSIASKVEELKSLRGYSNSAKLWRKAELELDKLAQNLPLEFRQEKFGF